MGSSRTSIVAVTLGLALSGCFSGFSVTRYRSPSASGEGPRKIAVVPLIIVAATETKSSFSHVAGWFSQTSIDLPMSPAEYEPAQAAVVEALGEALADRVLVGPREVDAAMRARGEAPGDERTVARAIAETTSSEGVLVTRIRNFNQRPAALENAQASGTMDLTLYDAAGEVVWSLAAEVVRGPAGTNAAPTLTQFVEYAMARFEPEVRELARRR